MVARQGFWSGIWTHPDGSVTPAHVWVPEGCLADERSAIVRRYRDNWRRPTRSERKGAA
jgi:hypothetical protein